MYSVWQAACMCVLAGESQAHILKIENQLLRDLSWTAMGLPLISVS